jgi:hypothetical protein
MYMIRALYFNSIKTYPDLHRYWSASLKLILLLRRIAQECTPIEARPIDIFFFVGHTPVSVSTLKVYIWRFPWKIRHRIYYGAVIANTKAQRHMTYPTFNLFYCTDISNSVNRKLVRCVGYTYYKWISIPRIHRIQLTMISFILYYTLYLVSLQL